MELRKLRDIILKAKEQEVKQEGTNLAGIDFSIENEMKRLIRNYPLIGFVKDRLQEVKIKGDFVNMKKNEMMQEDNTNKENQRSIKNLKRFLFNK